MSLTLGLAIIAGAQLAASASNRSRTVNVRDMFTDRRYAVQLTPGPDYTHRVTYNGVHVGFVQSGRQEDERTHYSDAQSGRNGWYRWTPDQTPGAFVPGDRYANTPRFSTGTRDYAIMELLRSARLA